MKIVWNDPLKLINDTTNINSSINRKVILFKLKHIILDYPYFYRTGWYMDGELVIFDPSLDMKDYIVVGWDYIED